MVNGQIAGDDSRGTAPIEPLSASSPEASARMSRHPRRDTSPELSLRRRLHGMGLRYRVHVRPQPDLRRVADVVFPRALVAVFVDGCFWHGCPAHGVRPRANGAWWAAKLDRNRTRDLDTTARLQAGGWTVIRVWEHDDPDEAAARIAAAVAASKQPRRTPAPR